MQQCSMLHGGGKSVYSVRRRSLPPAFYRRNESMMPPLAQQMLTLLCAKAPRQAAESILEFLANDSGSTGAALFSVSDAECALFYGKEIDGQVLDWCYAKWRESSRRLLNGFSVREDLKVILPISGSDRTVVALVYLEAAAVDEATALDVSPALADAVLRAQSGPIRSVISGYVEHTPLDEMERERLKLLFSRYEYFIARVARALGVSTQTIYRRLDKYGLREWVSKGRRAFQAAHSR